MNQHEIKAPVSSYRDNRGGSTHLHEIKQLNELMDNLDDPEKLSDYLRSEMKGYTENITEAFKKHLIDGYSFQMFEEEHIDEMDLDLNIGQKLRLLTKAAKVKRSLRLKRRNSRIMDTRCILFTGGSREGIPGRVILTNSALKFKFETSNSIVQPLFENGKVYKSCYCCGSLGTEHIKASSKILDHVDLSLIEDVDLQEVEITKRVTRQRIISCCTTTTTEETAAKNYIYIALKVKAAIREMDAEIMGNTGDSTHTTILKVEIEKKDKAREFRDKLIDAVEEVQLEEGSRY